MDMMLSQSKVKSGPNMITLFIWLNFTDKNLLNLSKGYIDQGRLVIGKNLISGT